MKELKFIEVERRNPAREELDSSEILVGDVGMEFNPKRNNFDHHQDKYLPCAFAMVFQAEPVRFLDIKKIIVHGGFVAHLDEIYMTALLDSVLNRKEPNATYMQQGDLTIKISTWDTMGPNEYKKRYPNDWEYRIDKDRALQCIKLKTDKNKLMQMSCFWIGMFEQLLSIEIIVDDLDLRIEF
jgi:hypothetical protein